MMENRHMDTGKGPDIGDGVNPKDVDAIAGRLKQSLAKDVGQPGGKSIFGRVGGIFGKAREKVGDAAGGIGQAIGKVDIDKENERFSKVVEGSCDQLGKRLQNLKIFGRPSVNFLTEMGAGMAASAAAKTVARELVINFFGSAATGFAGRVAIGAAAGLVVGAGREGVKQAVKNWQETGTFNVDIQRQINENAMAGGTSETARELAAQKKNFLERIKPTDMRAIVRSALRGAIFGAVGGALAAAVMDIWESSGGDVGQLISNIPGVQGVGNLAGGIGGGAGNIASGAGETGGNLLGGVGNLAGGAGETVGNLAGGAGEAGGNVLGGAGQLPGVEGVGNIAGDIGGGVGNVAGGIGGAVGETAGNLGQTIGNVAEGAGQLPVLGGIGDIAGGAGETVGNLAGGIGETGGNLAHGVGDLAGNIPGVHGVGDALGVAGKTIGDTAGNLGRAVGLDQAHEAAQVPDKPDIPQVPDKPDIPQDLGKPDVPQPLQVLKDAASRGEGLNVGGHQFTPEQVSALAKTFGGEAVAVSAVEAHVAEAVNSLGDSIPLPAGSNPWEVSKNILTEVLGHNPSPAQIMEIDRIICAQNGISVPAWGIPGNIDHYKLPIGFPIKLDDTVKNAILAIAKK